MRHLIPFIFCIFFGIPSVGTSQIIDTVGNTEVQIDSLVGFGGTAYDWPWDLYWGPDDKLWFTVGDKICRYDTTSHLVDTLFKRTAQLCNTMSVVTHPDFVNYPYVYVTIDTANYYYSYSGGPIVLYRYTYSATGDSLYNETAILSWGHPGEHCGGRLMVSSDNYLYCTTAEYNFAGDTIGNINGRVLRINLDGTVPSINVSGGYSISKGHRNPQGIVEVPNGNIIVSELGAIVDELNLITENSNYGWPAYDGENDCFFTDSCNSSTFQFQLPIDTATRPPSGITYYDHPAIPEFQGCILQSILSFGGYQGGLVASKLNVAMNDIVSDVHYFKGEYFRFRDVCSSPDGKVYVITNDRQFPVIRCISNLNYYSGMEVNENTKFNAYPNPANDAISVEASKNIGSWEMLHSHGKIVSKGFSPTMSFQIDVSNLTSGIYFIKTWWGSMKFIKQ